MLLTPQCDSQCVVFGDFRFNVPTRELLRIGNHGAATPVTLGSRAADLLHLFLDRPGELITKSEIMDAVWPNTAVEESNLTVQVSALRRALGGGRNGARYIQTVPGRGYRFSPWADDFTTTLENAKAAFATTANGSRPLRFAGEPDAPRTAAGGASRPSVGAPADSLDGLPEMSALTVPTPLAAISQEETPGAVLAAAPLVRRTNIWWLSWLNGVAGIVLGMMLVTTPGITAAALVSFLGFYWLIMGMLTLARIFVDPSAPWGWPLVIGVAGILAGVFVARHLLIATLIMPTAIVVGLGLQSLVIGALEIAAGVIGAGVASFILGSVYGLAGLLLLGSLHAAVLAAPVAFGALFLLQGATLTLFALRSRGME